MMNKMVTQVMKNELAMLENMLEGTVANILPPTATRFIFNSPMYKQYLGKVEDILIMYMDKETGEIDGEQAHEMLSQMYPTITQFISLPQEHFKIGDLVNQISIELIGRSVM